MITNFDGPDVAGRREAKIIEAVRQREQFAANP